MFQNIPMNFKSHEIEKHYKRNGVKCVFDPIREILIVETPEEIVRQKAIYCLLKDLNVPKNKIDIEVPMTHFSKGAKGRADIVVYGETNDHTNVPVIVFECKAPSVSLTDDVWDQVISYDHILGSGFVVISNGTQTHAAKYDENEDAYFYVEEIPEYQTLLKGTEFKYVKETKPPWKRPEFCELLSKHVIDQYKDFVWIGEDTETGLYPFIFNLVGFIQDTSVKFSPFNTNSFKVIEDGDRYTSFGNAAGGSWAGDYRYFILEDAGGNNQIVSISIMGSLKAVDHPVFGNRRGKTVLIVAIDNFEKKHNSLQLDIDKYIKKNGNFYTLWHDGSITIGKKGAAKRSEMIEFIKKHDRTLLNQDEIVILGTFDISKEISWEQPESRKFISNIIKYSLIRDEFRKMKSND